MNILLLSNIYPLPIGNKGTPVCHYFAKEWQKMGHNVRVVHAQAVYPKYFYWIAQLAAKTIASRTGALVYTERDKGGKYEYEGIPVLRFPLFKYLPHSKYKADSINLLLKTIINDNQQNSFIPDVLLGHFINPSLEIISCLKRVYPNSVSAVISHGENKHINIFKSNYKQLLQNIDAFGFRSKAIKEDMSKYIEEIPNSFICYSGIPEKMIINRCGKTFDTPTISNFIYVGSLIKRKFPISVIQALNSIYPQRDFRLKYIGDGAERKSIENYVSVNHLGSNVIFTGRLPRQDILSHLDEAECFAMISKGEAFGLVYLEAMARGCITIAARNEGIDGIIIDGYNGFLCEAGNTNELVAIIKRINDMTPEKRRNISENALKTARGFTDKLVADRYLHDVINFKRS